MFLFLYLIVRVVLLLPSRNLFPYEKAKVETINIERLSWRIGGSQKLKPPSIDCEEKKVNFLGFCRGDVWYLWGLIVWVMRGSDVRGRGQEENIKALDKSMLRAWVIFCVRTRLKYCIIEEVKFYSKNALFELTQIFDCGLNERNWIKIMKNLFFMWKVYVFHLLPLNYSLQNYASVEKKKMKWKLAFTLSTDVPFKLD